MGKYIQNTTNIKHQGKVNPVSVSKEIYEEIKKKVSIPMYFYSIIVPQLGSYYDNYPVDFDAKIVVCCPLHSEDTPSFRFYEETNSFYCFGCQKGGDVIQLHMYFAEVLNSVKPTREEAAYFLYQYFIKDRQTENFISPNVVPKENLNEDKDIVRLNVYRMNLENSITYDRNIKLESKQKIWDILDNIDVLIEKGLIKASDAKQYIQQQVKEIITPESSIKQHKKIEIKNKEAVTNG